jgi:type I restriction enzyme, R subunit
MTLSPMSGTDTKPFLMSIGEKAEALAEAFRDRQVSTEDALRQLTLLAEETLEAEKAQTATGLPPDAFATLWYLRGKGLPEPTADTVARAAAQAFDESPQWRARSDQERQVRMKLHAALIRAGQKEGTGAYVEDIVASLRRVQP